MRKTMLCAALMCGAAAATQYPLSASFDETPGSEFDCAVREYAYQYGVESQGWRGRAFEAETWDALQLTTLCNQTLRHKAGSTQHPDSKVLAAADRTVFVHPSGSDAAAGTKDAPFGTVQHAVQHLRLVKTPGEKTSVVLREGVHVLRETLKLTEADSDLTIQNQPGEAADMSGAVPITTNWVAASAKGVYYTDLSSQNVAEIRALRVGDKRGFRASFPNRNPETAIFPEGWVRKNNGDVWHKPKTPKTAPVFVEVDSPKLTDKTLFTTYTVGINGTCEIFTPPVSYWCSEKVSGGGAFRFRVPSGLTVNESVAKLPAYANASTGILTTWRPAHWAVWMFQIESYNAATQSFEWTYGGFQGARGDDNGSDWFLENLIEELDAPNEYFFDENTQRLYYMFNTSDGKPDPSLVFAVVNEDTLISKVGASPAAPIKNVEIVGVTIRDSAPTYMSPHGVPSGGDWALQRMGAIFFENTELCKVESSLLTRLDGNGIMISGYNRNTTINKNELTWIGGSAIASWGYTNPYSSTSNDTILGQYKSGVSSTDNEHPRYTTVTDNYVHELGHWEKQASFYFQAKTALTTISGNVAFNMPRAGINFNDGFGGGNSITKNILYNTCRESSDHANFNSWDRQPFLSDVLDGSTYSFTPAFNDISHNFLLGNYGAVNTVDNDDGSSWYNIHHNFLVRGGHKSNFGGHDKYSYNNINANARVYSNGLCLQMNAVNFKNATDGYYNNTCTQDLPNLVAYNLVMCDPTNITASTGIPIMHDNKIYNKGAKLLITCGKSQITHDQLLAAGHDKGTTVNEAPPVSQVIEWAKALLKDEKHQ